MTTLPRVITPTPPVIENCDDIRGRRDDKGWNFDDEVDDFDAKSDDSLLTRWNKLISWADTEQVILVLLYLFIFS